MTSKLPRTYEFEFTCDRIFKGGRIFKKHGIVKALHQRDAIKEVKKLCTCKNIIVKPYLAGKVTGTDFMFGNIYN